MERESLGVLDEFQRELVNTCGKGCYQKCMGLFFAFLGGVRMTIPDMEEMIRRERNRNIRAEFNGQNSEELAFKYQLKARQVRNIVNRS